MSLTSDPMRQDSDLADDSAPVHLRSGGTSVIVDLPAHGLPVILWWGRDLGLVDDRVLRGIAVASHPQRVSGGLDEPSRLSVMPLESSGWQGTPGLVASRGGLDAYPRFTVVRHELRAGSDGVTLDVEAADVELRLGWRCALRVDTHGLLHLQASITNSAAPVVDAVPFTVDELGLCLPIPSTATEVLDATGRHLRERSPQRHLLTTGRYDRESRRGRPGADGTLVLAAGRPGFGFSPGTGQVHAIHLAWSGNHRLSVERTASGQSLLRAAELLLPSEGALAPGETYRTPEVIASWGDGLDEVAGRIHAMLRARPTHPNTPRPVTLNTWEAVYFDHDLNRLVALANRAAAIGVERFVLDDGWFRGRRDDTAGLGDWYVDEAVWPDGLAPLVDHVTGLGMQFGLWVEPEMVNPDSDLARAHPEWILGPEGRAAPFARTQQVLDLSNPDAYRYIRQRMLDLLDRYEISYLKWDHNRDLVEARSARTGRPAVHAGVVALYRLLDELRAAHPGLEIETCASGGARVDLGILQHTDRIWTSDCIDPLERLTIQKYTGLLVPPELMGSHISGPQSHSTHRRHDLAFRAGVALLGHLGVEWDISTVDDEQITELAAWIAFYKRHRTLLHTGTVVHADEDDEFTGRDVRGVVAADGAHGLFVLAQARTSTSYPPTPFTLPGLTPDRPYEVRLSTLTPLTEHPGQTPLLWAINPPIVTGDTLGSIGLQTPVLFPEHLVVIEVTAADRTPGRPQLQSRQTSQ